MVVASVYRRLGDLPGLGDIQRIPALVKFRAIPIRKGKVEQDAVAVRHRGFLPCQGNGGGAADGGAGKAGEYGSFMLFSITRVPGG